MKTNKTQTNKAHMIVLGDKLSTIMIATHDILRKNKLEAKELCSIILQDSDAKNAAQITVYGAVDTTAYCTECEAWHVTLDSIPRITNFLQQLHDLITSKFTELCEHDHVEPKVLSEYLSYLLQAIAEFEVQGARHADSPQVFH